MSAERDEMLDNTIGERIIKQRLKKGYSQTDFAKLIPISQSTLSKWENGSIIPPYYQLRRICELLDISIGHFFEIDEIESNRLQRKLFFHDGILVFHSAILIGVLVFIIIQFAT